MVVAGSSRAGSFRLSRPLPPKGTDESDGILDHPRPVASSAACPDNVHGGGQVGKRWGADTSDALASLIAMGRNDEATATPRLRRTGRPESPIGAMHVEDRCLVSDNFTETKTDAALPS